MAVTIKFYEIVVEQDDIQSRGKFDYHHNFFEGPVDRNTKFYDPAVVYEFVGKV